MKLASFERIMLIVKLLICSDVLSECTHLFSPHDEHQ